MRAAKLVLMLLVIALSACGPGAPLDSLADAGAAKVAAAASGDSVRLEDGRTIALAGVAAPAPGEPYSAEARAALQDFAAGRSVRLLYGGDPAGPFHLRDTRRRWFQEALLEAGAVRVRTGADDRALADALLRAEARARAARNGLWALPAYEVRLPSEVVARRETGFLLVEGRVLRAAEQGGRLYLEFSRDWRGGFSAGVPLQAVPGFTAAGLDLKALEGKLIRVRGEVVTTRYGPRLTLDHPEQVERLADN